LTGHLEHSPKIVKVFDHKFPVAFQPRDREKERASWNKGVYLLRHDFIIWIIEGGMRFTFPPYGYCPHLRN
jgi:hypothetical protein